MEKKVNYPVDSKCVGFRSIYTYKCNKCGKELGGYHNSKVTGNILCRSCRYELGKKKEIKDKTHYNALIKRAKEVSKALKCSSGVCNHPCESCEYRILEDIPADLAEFAKGKTCWESCDVDRISKDAAELLDAFAGKQWRSKNDEN